MSQSDNSPDATGYSLRPFVVEIEEVITRSYEVEARSVEEAEIIAERYWEEGEPGDVKGKELYNVSAIEGEQDESGN